MGKVRGFSLIEILIVLAIIAGIAGLLVSNLDSILGSSNERIASIFVNETVRVPLMAYKIDMGNYPSSAEGLQALMEPPIGKEWKWRGPYMESLPKDPWGYDYCYAFPGKHSMAKYDIWSNGGTGEKKIGNW